MDFGKIILAARDKAGLSQVQLAERAKIDRTYLSKIENHNLIPDSEIFRRITRELGNSPKINFLYSCIVDEKPPKETWLDSILKDEKELIAEILFWFVEGRANFYKDEGEFIKAFLAEFAPGQEEEKDLYMKITKELHKLNTKYLESLKSYAVSAGTLSIVFKKQKNK